MQFALTLASCLGFVFDSSLLIWILAQEEKLLADKMTPNSDLWTAYQARLQSLLEYARTEGLVESVSPSHWKFSHDRVRQCFYAKFQLLQSCAISLAAIAPSFLAAMVLTEKVGLETLSSGHAPKLQEMFGCDLEEKLADSKQARASALLS